MYKEKILIGTDTTSGIAPQILDAIAEASNINTLPYGYDVFTEKCKNVVNEKHYGNYMHIAGRIGNK